MTSPGQMPDPLNPYAPPAVDIDAPPVGADGLQLATRGERLAAAIIDSVAYAAMTVPAYLGVSFAEFGKQSQDSVNPFLLYVLAGKWGLLAGALGIALLIVQWTLVGQRGQSLGKILLGTRIVRLDGGPAPAGKTVALRAVLPMVVALIPKLGQVLTIIDVLFIFRRDQRCLHDLLAGTKVIKLKKPA